MRDYLRPPVPVPASVGIVGGLVCAISGLALLPSFGMLVMYFGVYLGATPLGPVSGSLHSPALLQMLGRLAFWAAVLVASIAFMSLHAWARIGMQVVLGVFSVTLLYAVVHVLSRGDYSHWTETATTVMSAGLIVAFALIPVVGIMALRKPAVRDAFAAAAAARNAAKSAAPVAP